MKHEKTIHAHYQEVSHQLSVHPCHKLRSCRSLAFMRCNTAIIICLVDFIMKIYHNFLGKGVSYSQTEILHTGLDQGIILLEELEMH